MKHGPDRRRYPWESSLAAALFVLCLPAGALADPWPQDGREAPLHPTIITVAYEGKTLPVVAASAEFPEIEAGGKLRRLHEDQSYQTPRAVAYAPGYITFRAQNATSTTRSNSVRIMMHGDMNPDGIQNGPLLGDGKYECTLVSERGLADCYMAVIFYRTDTAGDPVAASTAIAFRQIGELKAGRETRVTINSGYVVPPGIKWYYFPLVFSKGLEIRTDQCENAARYFRRGEMDTHSALLAHYRQQNPGADKPASAYLRFRPELPPGVDPRSLPPTITARFAVTETGEVDGVELDHVLDVKVDREIRRALGGWLFMPRLKKGYPVRSMITVPLSFGQDSS